MLELRKVSKAYPRKPDGASATRGSASADGDVLRNVDFRLVPGEFVAIVGESGAGKSTLLNLMAGLEVPDAGEIVADGAVLSAMDETGRTLWRRARLGFVFQAFHLLPHLTVAANVGLPLALNGVGGRAAADRVRELLAAVGLAGRADDHPAELSGGEMQRVAVARSLAHRPSWLLADEPTGNLDAEAADQVLALLANQARREGAGTLLVTHSERAAATADSVYVLARAGLTRR